MIRFEHVSYTYPFHNQPAVRDVTFAVKPGELVLCTGKSGCGKSTVMRLANGLCPQYYEGTLAGVVSINGKNTTEYPIHLLADEIGTLFQNPEEQFFALQVEDEIVFAHEWKGLTHEEIRERLDTATQDFGLASILQSSVHHLSEGQKQKVGLASVLTQKPRALILDEPTANLDPEATAELALQLQRLKAQGLAILVVDHRLYWLDGIADQVLVMDRGSIAERGDFSILHDASLRERYGLRRCTVDDPRPRLPDVSEDVNEDVSEDARVPGDCLLVRNLDFSYPEKAPLFANGCCAIPPGITALVGDNGAGKTTFARLVTGLNRPDSGSFVYKGSVVDGKTLLRQASIVLQNADHQLYMRSVLEEVIFSLSMSTPGTRQAPAALTRQAVELLELFDLQLLAERHPQSLSGGEKQRLVIACALAKNPELLILDEPTSGLDGENMLRIARALETCASRGAFVLVITHDLELMDAVCTRALRLPLAGGVHAFSTEGANNWHAVSFGSTTSHMERV